MNTHTIAIDFGTTKTLVSHINPRTNSPEIIRLGRDGRDYIPTTAYIDKSGKFYFGDDADDLIEEREGQYLRGFKMKLGSSNQIAFSKKDGKICRYSAKDLVERYLRHIREEVENLAFMGEKISTATITHPVAFSPLQLQDLTQAAQNAGFENVSFITEPEAAGIAFCKENAAQAFRKNALIVDWGGGTLDIALVTRKDGIIQTHPTLASGLNGIGGELFDECLWSHIIACLQEKGNYKLDASSQIKHVRRGKERLSKHEDVKLHLSTLSGIVCPGIQISRNTFEKLIDTHVDKAVDKILRLVQQIPAENKPEFLLLVGGSSLIPCIKKKLEATCGLQAQSWHKSREAVSIGAAYHSTASGTKNIREILTDKSALENWLQQGNDANARLEAISSETGEAVSASLIFIPAISGNIKCVETLLRYGADINAKDSLGRTVLHAVTYEQNNEMVDFLLTHKANPDLQDNDGDTPLLAALRAKSYNTAKLLFDAGAGTNIKNNEGKSANDYLPSSWKHEQLRVALNERQSAIDELRIEYGIHDNYDAELIFAAGKGAIRKLACLISAGANVNFEDPDLKLTPLSFAVQNDHIEIVKYLLTTPHIDINKGSPLRKAIINNDMGCFDILLGAPEIDVNSALCASAVQKNTQFLYKLLNRKEVDINIQNGDGLTPLHLAVIKNNTDHVNRLLQHPSIDVNKETKNGNSALMLAISAGSTGAFNLLIKSKKLRINHRNNEGYTALHIAIKEKAPITFIQMLLNYKDVRVNDKTTIAGYTPLHWALKNDYTEAALLLLQNSHININEQDDNGNSLLHIAALYNRDEIMEKMLKIKGIQVNRTNKRGDTPLLLAVEKNNISAALHLLNYQGIDVNCVNSEKNTPLHIAVAQTNLDIIKNLTTHKNASAGINQRNIYGITPLILAVTHKKADFVQALLKVENIDVNRADNAGNTPLHLAADQNQRFILELLLKACRIDVNARNNEGNTPLHIAAKKKFPQIVSALLGKKCSVNPKNNNKVTPFSYTTIGFGLRNPFNQCYDILKKAGGKN